jgi:membrane dipeptidase
MHGMMAARDDHARALHAEAIIINCHDHIPAPVDLGDLQTGGVTAKFALVSTDAEIWAQERGAFLGSLHETEGWCMKMLGVYDVTLSAVESHPAEMLLARTAADVLRAKREGKVAILLGSEGGKLIEGRLDLLRTFFRLGLRQMQLTWAYSNRLSAAETELETEELTGGYMAPEHVVRPPPGQEAGGLTEIGRQVIAEMNRLGVIVDICHLSRPAMREAMSISRQPILAGHTTARALGHRLPSLTDDEIRAVARQGGVIGLHFMTHMLTGRWEPHATMDEVLDQIDYLVNLGGADVLGLGPDYNYDPDGRLANNTKQPYSYPVGLEDSSKMLNLTRALVAHGYDDESILKILGKNLMRLLAEVAG